MSRGHEAGSSPPAVQLRHVIDSLADGVVLVDLEGRRLLCNAAARRLSGMDLADVPVGRVELRLRLPPA